ncbi:MAG: SapC family protein [Burkholderiaceae bacterium]|nr:SapC family protein [Burkholderiaceae bacterium]
MFEKVVPVNRERHAKVRIREMKGFGFAAKFHIAYLTMHEFPRAAGVYAIVFLDDERSDSFRPVALIGLDAGENLFVSADGAWEASYVPAIIRRYPFALAAAGTEGQFTICIDEGSELVSDTEGNALFDENGEPTQVIENVKRYLAELQQMDQATQAFCAWLKANNMFTPLSMRVRDHDKVRNIAGCYVVSEERLNNLSDERFLELRSKRFLPAIYAQLMSLAQIDRLITLKDRRVAEAAQAVADSRHDGRQD